jgi:hypothetical protein
VYTTSFNFINFFAYWTINTTQFRHAEFQDECKVERLLAMISRSVQNRRSNYPSENLAGSRRPIFSQQFLYTIYTSGARDTGPFALAPGLRRLSASAISEHGAAGRVATGSSIASLAGELPAQIRGPWCAPQGCLASVHQKRQQAASVRLCAPPPPAGALGWAGLYLGRSGSVFVFCVALPRGLVIQNSEGSTA